MDTGKLITLEEYSKVKHDTPYFYALGSSEQKIYYFGERHSRDPQDTE